VHWRRDQSDAKNLSREKQLRARQRFLTRRFGLIRAQHRDMSAEQRNNTILVHSARNRSGLKLVDDGSRHECVGDACSNQFEPREQVIERGPVNCAVGIHTRACNDHRINFGGQ